MKTPWPEFKLEKVLTEVSRPENIDPKLEYRLLGMRWYAGGLFEKERKKGQDIRAAKIYRVEKGDLIYNRLFAWKGSFGIAGATDAGAYVSNEFPCFTIDEEQVLPEYLKWCMARLSFWLDVETLSTGSSRQSRLRLKQERFLGISIHIPSLPEQKYIVDKIEQVAIRVRESISLSEKVEEEQKVLLLRKVEEMSEGVPHLPMAEVAPVIRRHVTPQPDEWYPELGIRSFGKGTFHKDAVKGSELGTKRIYRIEPGDLLFSNVFSWEGAIAVVQPEDKGRFGSHRFITCVPDPDCATAEFLCFWFLTDEGLADIRAASPGAAGRNKTLGIEKLEAIEVPNPPVEKQRQFSELANKFKRVRNVRRQIALDLEYMMPALLNQAFRGEL
jgi:type I restriction enzyme S subunit